ncbi:MAG: hypothetical protein JWM92_464 [Candidatus Nomurabacteria bacterium]|nr:hypothetical protein [Candidatus Nomurabacteria bacterium]
MWNLIIFFRRNCGSAELPIGYRICKNATEQTVSSRRKKRVSFRRIVNIPVPTKNVSVKVEDTGLIYVFNNDKPWEEPRNIGSLIKNFLLRTSQKVYW